MMSAHVESLRVGRSLGKGLCPLFFLFIHRLFRTQVGLTSRHWAYATWLKSDALRAYEERNVEGCGRDARDPRRAGQAQPLPTPLRACKEGNV